MMLIGDCHSKYDKYLELANSVQDSIQLGDIGFDFDYDLLPDGAKCLVGNHNNYDKLIASSHNLGDFGQYKDIFFIRGAHSPDKYLRTEGTNWWRNEELSYTELSDCIQMYQAHKPDIVISHTCPKFFIPYLGGNYSWGTITEVALEQMWSIHQPLLWVFGHFHRSRSIEYNRTRFVCLNELEILEL